MLKKAINFFALFGSLSTLLCCALPVTLVSIGMGATFASLTSTFPQIIWLGQYKGTLFILTGILLVLSFLLMKKSETMACPVDSDLQEACSTSKQWSKPLYWVTVIIYIIGLLFSYVLPKVLYGL